MLSTQQNPIATSNSKVLYLSGLNGLRALAALAVVVSHITLGLDEFGLDNNIFGTEIGGKVRGLSLARNGVTIFFTLSGFLITYLLLKEKEITKVSIKNFYVRRILRIWPLYYLYFFLCMAITITYQRQFHKESIPFYIFLAANIPLILGKTLPLLAHYWSLGVEEQFYLFFPHFSKFSLKGMTKLTLLLIAGLLALKVVFWILAKKYGIDLPYNALSTTRFHIMLTGSLAAILFYNGNEHFLAITTHKVTQIFSWLCVFLIAMNKFDIPDLISSELVAIISVCLIIGQVTKRNRIVNLENNVFDFIGKISFGIYVIHPMLIFLLAKSLGSFEDKSIWGYVLVYSLVIGSTIGVAYLSYEYYEKRFLKMKTRFTAINSSASRKSQ